MSHRLKLERADHHLRDLKDAIKVFMDREPYTLVGKDDAEAGEHVICIRVRESQPPVFSLLVGDFVSNARAALDHLAFALAAAHTPVLAKPGAVQFPICSSADNFAQQQLRIRELSSEAQAIIERLQPYHGWQGAGPHPLALLADLSNTDKHRLLILTVAVVAAGELEVRRIGTGPSEGYLKRGSGLVGPLVDGAEVFRLGSSAAVDMQLKTMFVIAFEKEGPGAGMPVRDALDGVTNAIRGVVFLALEPLLKGHDIPQPSPASAP